MVGRGPLSERASRVLNSHPQRIIDSSDVNRTQLYNFISYTFFFPAVKQALKPINGEVSDLIKKDLIAKLKKLLSYV